MGMYDCINFKMDCPECGFEVDGFQSKDADCNLDLIDPIYVNYFYSSCGKCGLRITLERFPKEMKTREIPYTLEEVKSRGFKLKVKRWTQK